MEPTKLLCLWDFSGKNTGTGCHFLLQGFFPTQGSISCILCPLHCRWILYPKPPGKPLIVSFTVGEVEKITGGAVSGSDSSLTESLTFAKKHHIDILARVPIDPEIPNLSDKGMIEMFNGSYMDECVEKIEEKLNS